MTSQSGLAIGIIALVGLAAATVGAQTQPRVPRFKEDVHVTSGERPSARGSSADHWITFSGPFALPDMSLAAGTYVFRPGPANTLQVLSADGSTAHAWLLTIPVSRPVATRSYEVRFGDPAAAGAPRRLTTLFEPRQSWGYELVYAPRQAGGAETGKPIAQASR